MREGSVKWQQPNGQTHQLTLRAAETYVLPWGTKIRLEKQTGGTAWRLVASRADRDPLPQTLHSFGRRQV